VYNSFVTSFCTIYIDWCTISYLLYLFTCTYLCAALDDPQFEEQQQVQGFEGSEQQQFQEGKWPLIILLSLEIH